MKKLTPDKLRIPHNSIPANVLLAEPMYLKGYIERMGTGTIDIINRCKEAGLKKAPEFIQEEIFKTIIWRSNSEESNVYETPQVTPQVDEYIKRVVIVVNKEAKRSDIQDYLGLKDRKSFIDNYLNPTIQNGYITMKYPDNPNHPQQCYTLINKGKRLKNEAKTIIWRNNTDDPTGQVTGQVNEKIINNVDEKVPDKVPDRVGDKVGDRVGDRVGDKLSSNQKLIIEYMEEDPFISAKKIAEKIGISLRKIETNIQKLKKMGLLNRIGSAKGGYWVAGQTIGEVDENTKK